MTLRAQGELARAPELHEEALAGLLRVLGDNHPATLGFDEGLAEVR